MTSPWQGFADSAWDSFNTGFEQGQKGKERKRQELQDTMAQEEKAFERRKALNFIGATNPNEQAMGGVMATKAALENESLRALATKRNRVPNPHVDKTIDQLNTHIGQLTRKVDRTPDEEADLDAAREVLNIKMGLHPKATPAAPATPPAQPSFFSRVAGAAGRYVDTLGRPAATPKAPQSQVGTNPDFKRGTFNGKKGVMNIRTKEFTPD